jgi:hypothetical protein
MKNDNNFKVSVFLLFLGIILAYVGIILCCKVVIEAGIPLICIAVISLVGFGILYRKFYTTKTCTYTPDDTRPIDKLMREDYGLKSTTETQLLCDYITTVTTQFNIQNKTSVTKTRVASLLFHRYKNHISMLSYKQLVEQNSIPMATIAVCCVIASDNKYKQLCAKIWESTEIYVSGYNHYNLKKDFLDIMDDCYIDLAVRMTPGTDYEKIPSLDNNTISTEQLLGETINLFKQKYQQTNDDFFINK